MKKLISLFIAIIILQSLSHSQSTVFRSFDAKNSEKNIFVLDSVQLVEMLEQILFAGDIQVQNLSYTGNYSTIGYFSDENNSTGLDCGIAISTGFVEQIANPVSFFASHNFNLPGDSALSAYIGGPTFDAIIIEFDIIANDSLFVCSDYVFGSEEYPEYVNTAFNDMFGFFVSGPKPDGGYYDNENIALIPGTDLPVAINNVNNGLNNDGNCMNCDFYISNEIEGNEFFAMDGMTTVLPADLTIIPDSAYHIRLAVSDVGDGIFDSNVLMRVFAFSQTIDTMMVAFSYNIISENPLQVQYIPIVDNEKSENLRYFWNFGDGNFSFEESPIHSFAEKRNYKTSLFVTGGKSKGVVSELLPTGIARTEIGINKRIVSSDNYNVIFKDNMKDAKINILSVDGKTIYSSVLKNTNELKVNISGLAKGAYIVVVDSELGRWQDKFIKID